MRKYCTPRVLLLGPSRNAVSGISTHINQMFRSTQLERFRLQHFQAGSQGSNETPQLRLYRLFASPMGLVSKIIRTRSDIVHVNSALDNKAFVRDSVYVFIAVLLGQKVIYQVHGGQLPATYCKKFCGLCALIRFVLRVPHAVVVVSEEDELAYRSFANPRYLVRIPNAVDLADYAYCSPKQFMNDTFKLVFLGQLKDVKGVLDLINTMNLLISQMGVTNIKLDIAGSGPAEQVIAERIKAYSLDSSVRFIGPVFGKEKIQFWKQADLFVFPTYHTEKLPYTILESLASGTPVIVTPVGGIVDVISDGIHGLFVQPGDPAKLAAAILRLDSDRTRLRRMSNECLKHAKEHYGVDRMGKQFAELFGQIAT